MGWFVDRMGFVETTPDAVRTQLVFDGTHITSKVTGVRLGCGRLETPSLAELRARSGSSSSEPSRVTQIVDDVASLHREHPGALFQAASQFNLLEMVSPRVTPEHGVDGYSHDKTQGPACAIACGGGTLYRNYYVPVGEQIGQTSTHQLDMLNDLETEFGGEVWAMRNGYALLHEAGLQHINAVLTAADASERDRLRGLLRIGVQDQVQVLDTEHTVTQVYGSALPVAYGRPPAALWEPFARLVLEASYEATLLAARSLGIRNVFLTYLGGGVFGNDAAWIVDAMVQAIERVPGLEIRLVSYGRPSPIGTEVVRRMRVASPG